MSHKFDRRTSFWVLSGVIEQSCNSRWRSFDSRQPLLPEIVKLQGRLHVSQAILGDFAVPAFGQQAVHVQAGDSVAFRRFDAEDLAVEIEVESPRRAVAAAHAVKGELFREIAMRLGLEPVTEPVLAADENVQNRRAQVNERHIETAPVEGDDVL